MSAIADPLDKKIDDQIAYAQSVIDKINDSNTPALSFKLVFNSVVGIIAKTVTSIAPGKLPPEPTSAEILELAETYLKMLKEIKAKLAELHTEHAAQKLLIDAADADTAGSAYIKRTKLTELQAKYDTDVKDLTNEVAAAALANTNLAAQVARLTAAAAADAKLLVDEQSKYIDDMEKIKSEIKDLKTYEEFIKHSDAMHASIKVEVNTGFKNFKVIKDAVDDATNHANTVYQAKITALGTATIYDRILVTKYTEELTAITAIYNEFLTTLDDIYKKGAQLEADVTTVEAAKAAVDVQLAAANTDIVTKDADIITLQGAVATEIVLKDTAVSDLAKATGELGIAQADLLKKTADVTKLQGELNVATDKVTKLTPAESLVDAFEKAEKDNADAAVATTAANTAAAVANAAYAATVAAATTAARIEKVKVAAAVAAAAAAGATMDAAQKDYDLEDAELKRLHGVKLTADLLVAMITAANTKLANRQIELPKAIANNKNSKPKTPQARDKRDKRDAELTAEFTGIGQKIVDGGIALTNATTAATTADADTLAQQLVVDTAKPILDDADDDLGVKTTDEATAKAASDASFDADKLKVDADKLVLDTANTAHTTAVKVQDAAKDLYDIYVEALDARAYVDLDASSKLAAATAQTDISTLDASLTASSASLVATQGDLATAQAELAALRIQLDAAIAMYAAAVTAHNTVSARHDELLQQAREYKTTIQNLQTELEEIKPITQYSEIVYKKDSTKITHMQDRVWSLQQTAKLPGLTEADIHNTTSEIYLVDLIRQLRKRDPQLARTHKYRDSPEWYKQIMLEEIVTADERKKIYTSYGVPQMDLLWRKYNPSE